MPSGAGGLIAAPQRHQTGRNSLFSHRISL
jgi:hypothetical protein